MGADRSWKHSFPLRGILYCDNCGAKYTGEQHKIKNGTIVRYLRCMKNIKGERVECGEKYFQEHHISEQFENLFKLIQLPPSITERLKQKIKKIYSNEQSLYEKSRKSILVKLETVKRQKKELILEFLDKAKDKRDEEFYDSVKTELETKEAQLNHQLGNVESNLTKTVKVLEIALVLANNCYRAYTKATPDLRGLLSKAFFERVAIKNGKIVSAVLNEPIDFLCKNRIKKHSVFKLNQSSGGERI